MLDFAELVVLNKFDKRGAEDALRDVRKQWKRNRTAFKLTDEQVPVYPTIASQFNDPGVTWMFANLCRLLRDKLHLPAEKWTPDVDTTLKEPRATVLIPGSRVRYLAEIAEQGRAINADIEQRGRGGRSGAAMWQESLQGSERPEAAEVARPLRSGRSSARGRGADRSVLVPAPALSGRVEGSLSHEADRACCASGRSALQDRSPTSITRTKCAARLVEGNNYVESLLAPEGAEDRRADVQELGRAAARF